MYIRTFVGREMVEKFLKDIGKDCSQRAAENLNDLMALYLQLHRRHQGGDMLVIYNDDEFNASMSNMSKMYDTAIELVTLGRAEFYFVK